MTAASAMHEPTASAPVQTVLDKVGRAKRQGRGWMARCPAHDDGTASLSIAEGRDGRALLNCHAGCTSEAIVAALGLSMTDLFPPRPALASRAERPARDPKERPALVKTYDYVDADRRLVMQSMRLRYTNGEKTFRQRKPDPDRPGEWVWRTDDVEPVLYHLPQLLDAIADGRRVYVVEGEKDVETLEGYGYAATTNVGGAGKWREAYSPIFRGADVAILPDNDDAGRSHAHQVAASLTNAGATVRVVELPGLAPKGDVSDWLADGANDLDTFAALVNRARVWSADPSARTRWRLDELLDNDTIMRPPPPVVPRLAWASRSTLLASAPKAGKSTLTGYVAAAVTKGGEWLGDRCQPGPVLIVGLEEFIGDAARRLRHFDADPKLTFLVDTLPSDPRERPSALRAHVEAVQPRLVIVDTLIAYGGIADLNAAGQVGPVVQEITDLAHALGPAVILVHHAKKADGKYRDSSAIGGAVDVIAEMYLPEPDSDPTLRKVRVVGRVPGGDFQMRYDGRHFLLDAVTELQATNLPIDQRILAAIKSRPGCHASTVVDLVGARAAAVYATINQMLADGRLYDEGHEPTKRLLHVR